MLLSNILSHLVGCCQINVSIVEQISEYLNRHDSVGPCCRCDGTGLRCELIWMCGKRSVLKDALASEKLGDGQNQVASLSSSLPSHVF